MQIDNCRPKYAPVELAHVRLCVQQVVGYIALEDRNKITRVGEDDIATELGCDNADEATPSV